MKRMTMPLLFAASWVAARAAAMSSPNYSTSPVVTDEGGGRAASTSYRTDVSIGKDLTGLATSPSYANELGFVVPVAAPVDTTPPGPVTGFFAIAAGDNQTDFSRTGRLRGHRHLRLPWYQRRHFTFPRGASSTLRIT